MPGRTQGEKLDETREVVATLAARLESLEPRVKAVLAEHAETVKALGEFRTAVARVEQQVAELARWRGELGSVPDLRTEVALLKRDVGELQKTRGEWTRRLWAMAGPILGAVIGVLLGYYLRK